MFLDANKGLPSSVDPVEMFEQNLINADDDTGPGFEQFFPDGWIQATTGYPSFRAFIDARFDEYESIHDIPEDALDDWVAEQSTFDCWDELVDGAARRWAEREFVN